MGRPVYQYELSDPDFSWLIDNFQDSNPGYSLSESTSLPMVFIKGEGHYPHPEFMPVSEEADLEHEAENG